MSPTPERTEIPEPWGEHCEICGTFVPGFEYQTCCGGQECGCQGRPIEPCICSEECWAKLNKPSETADIKNMVMRRIWEMPNKWTFKMKCVQNLLASHVHGDFADPFAGRYSPAAYRNDIEEDRNSTHKMDALDFLKSFNDNSLDGVLFDPPYSVEQCLRKYTPRFKGTAGRAEYWAKCKDEMQRIIKPGGIAISFCWDSTGVGKKRGFKIAEILLICHGACHNDTIVTVERKGS